MKRPDPAIRTGPVTVLMAALLLSAGTVGTAQQVPPPGTVPAATVIQPRAFGYYLGDLLEQRVLLDDDTGHFHPAALPPAERIGVWFERRDSVIETDTHGRRWLRVPYQLLNSPQEPATVPLPAWELASATGGEALHVPAWQLSVNPLSPRNPFDMPGLGVLQPDRPVPLADTGLLVRARGSVVALLAMTWLAWIGWWLWRNRSDAARLPFARAMRQVRPLKPADPQAWVIVHRALDQTAGVTVHHGNLDLLMERAPFLRGARSSLDQFLVQSGELFYGAGSASSHGEAHRLCAQLRRLERRGAT